MQISSWMISGLSNKGGNIMELSQMSDVAILNALFDIAAVEANGNGEYGEYGEGLTQQDEQEYQRLDWELSKRMGGFKQ